VLLRNVSSCLVTKLNQPRRKRAVKNFPNSG